MTKPEWILVSVSVVLCAASVFSIVPMWRRGSFKMGPLPPSPVPLRSIRPLAQVLAKGSDFNIVAQALDYECPPCHAQEKFNSRFRTLHPQVTWIVLQFPLRMHPHAYEFSLLAIEADKRGKFPEFHETVSSQTIDAGESMEQFLKRTAPSLVELTREDLRKNEGYRKLLSEIKRLPITGTPTYFLFRRDGRNAITQSSTRIEGFLYGAEGGSRPAEDKPCSLGDPGC